MKKKTYDGFTKLISTLLALILLLSLLPAEVAAAGVRSLAESLNDEAWLENEAIHVDVSKDSGAFYIRTVAGDKLVKGDEYANLLWPSEDDTSFTSVRITRNGVTKDYIFGKDYGSGNAVTVTNDGTQITAVWSVDSVTFTQTIRLQPTGNDAHGMVVINYSAENSGAPADVKLRVLLDTAMGSKDYAYYNTGSAAVVTETELDANGYDKSIYLMDDPSDPLVTGYILNGSVDGAESKPSKTVIAHWANLASTVYDYTPDTTLNFTNAFNAKHLTSDSAVALYYDLGSVAQGSTANAQFNYGLYSNEKVSGYAVAVNLQTIDALSFTDANESAFQNDGKFTAKTILQNASQKTYAKVRIYAYASGGISVLNSNESATDGNGKPYGYDNPYYVEINDFTPGQKVNNLSDWHFRAVMSAEANYGRIHFKAYDMSSNTGDIPLENDLIGQAKKYILVPGSQEKLPNIQLTGSSPTIFHTEGHRVFNITGMKFAQLESEFSDAYCTLKLSRKDGGAIRDSATVLELPSPSFAINEDDSGLMTVKIDGTLPEGEYKVTVDYTDAARDDLTAKALEFQVIDDGRYKCETYGFVVIYYDEAADKNGKNPKNNYLVKTFADEGMYNDWKDENDIEETDVLMIFEGVFDDLTESLPEDAGTLKNGESYACYLSASLSDNDKVIMSNTLEFSCQDPGSNVVIKQIQKGEDENAKHSVKVDLNCKVSIAGVGTTVFDQGVSCFTELKAGTRFKLIEYDEAGERDDTVGNTIALLWPSCDIVQQAIMGAFFNFRYAELGVIPNEDGGWTRTVGFGGGLDLSCIIPSTDQYYTWEEMYPQDEKYKMTADEERAWNEAWDIRNQDRSFRDENEARRDGALANGFYDEDDNFQYSGSVQVSDVLFGEKSFLGFNISVGVGIPSLAYNLPSIEGVFTLRTIGQTEFRVNGSMQFFNFEMEALLDLKSNDIGILIPDELKVFIGGVTPGIALDPWGVFWLQGGGGGIKDLYETIYLQDKVPPIKLIVQAQFSLMQVMVAKATVEAGFTGFGMSLSDVRIQGTDIGVMDSAVVALRWYPNIALIGSVQVDLLDCIQGGGYMVGYINYDGSNPFLEFFVRAALHLPGNIPIVGGMTVGDVNMGISSERIFGRAEAMGIGIGFSYYWRNEFDWGMKNEASPTFPELLGLGQEFDTDIDEMFENVPTPDDDDDDQDAGLNSPNAVPVYYDEENHRTLMAVPGTNFVRDNTVVLRGETGGSSSRGDSLQNTLNIAPDGKTIEASLANNGKSKIVVLSWNSNSEAMAKAEAETISTGGYTLTLLDHDRDANEQPSANANLAYDADAKQASLAVTVTDRSVSALCFTSAFAMDAVLYDVDALPELQGCTAALNGDSLTVGLSGNSLDSFDYVNVSLIKDSELAAAQANEDYIPEITLVGRIEKDAEGHLPASDTLVLPAGLPSGAYVVRLVAQDEAQTQASQLDLTEQLVNYVNPNTPGSPASIGSITGAGDWKVNVPISPGSADDFDGYAISVTDSEGNPVSGLTDLLFYRNGEMAEYAADGTMTVPSENPDAGKVTIGGHIEVPVSDTATDESGMTASAETLTETETIGFVAGSYIVSVRKWKAANGVPIYSEAITKSFNVTAPAPASLSITGAGGVIRTEQRGEESVAIPYYTNAGLLFTLNSDRPVTGTWVIDGMPDSSGYSGAIDNMVGGASIPLAGLGLADGVHSITFTGTTANGDSSSASFSFGVDNLAPALLICSPENGGAFDGTTGEITFAGTTDPDAAITIFDKLTVSSLTPTAMTIDPSTGDFTVTVTLEGGASTRQLMLAVSDDLGNRSEKSFTLRNSLLSSVTSLHLYEGDVDKTEQVLNAGNHTLRLVGRTADGQLVELSDPSMLEWDAQTLEGSALRTALSEDGTQFVIHAEEDTVGVITAKLLVNDTGDYPVSCMVGSTLSVNSDVITVAEGSSAPIGVSSKTGATLSCASADPSIATVTVDNDGIATVTGVKAGTTSVIVTSSTGESATVTVIVTGASGFVGHSLSLTGNIGVNFFVYLHEISPESAKVVFTWGAGKYAKTSTVELGGLIPGANGYYKTTAQVFALQMTDRIHAALYDGDQLVAEDEYSVAEYARYVVNETDENLLPLVGNDQDKLTKLRALCTAMLNYGAAAQYQFNYRTDDLPADLSEITFGEVTGLGTMSFPEGFVEACGIEFYASSLLLQSETGFRLYFSVEDQEKLDALVVKHGDETLSCKTKGDKIYYDLRNIPAACVLDDITLTFGELTVTVNPGDYISKALQSGNDTLKTTVTAQYWYCKAAQEYFQVH